MIRDRRLYAQICCNARNQVLVEVSGKGTSEKLHTCVPWPDTENAFSGKKCITYLTRIVLLYLLTFAFKYISAVLQPENFLFACAVVPAGFIIL